MNKPSLPKQKPVGRPRAKISKVTVLMPPGLHREVKKLAVSEHRSLSAQFIVFAEKGMAAVNG